MRFIFVRLHQLHKRTENKRHRGTYFMTDVHKKLNTCFIQFFHLTMLFKNPFGLEMFLDLQKYHIKDKKKQHEIDHNGQCRQVPYRMHHHCQLLHFGRLPVCLGFHTYAIGTRFHIDKGYTVLPVLQRNPIAIVDTVVIRHTPVAETHRGKFYTERLVAMRKIHLVHQRKPTVYNRVMSRTVTCMHRLTVDIKIHHTKFHFLHPRLLPHIRRTEQSQSVDTTEIQHPVLRIRSLYAELVSLQSVFDVVIVKGSFLRIKAGQAIVRAHPYFPVGSDFHATRGINRQPVFHGISLHAFVRDVETNKS